MADEQKLTHGNTVPPRVDTTSGWQGPNPTLNAGRTMSGDEFNRLRAAGDAARAGRTETAQGERQRTGAEILAMNLGNAGVPKAAALLIGQLLGRIEALDAQVNILHETIKNQNPPHLRKMEKRTAA